MSKVAAIQQERRSIDNLNPAEYNPRKRLQPGDEEYERLKTSIETFGYVDPIIINADGTVIGGHQRLFVLRDLGYSEADVAVVDLSKADEKALNIALNKISGEWDEEKLAEIFAELDAEGYDLSLTGFGEDEYADIVSALTDSLQAELLGDPDEVPEPPKEPVTLLGDVWQLGRHRLMCGDSTDKETVELLMDGNKVDMVFTDPPYNIGYQGVSDKRTIQNDKMSDDGFVDFLQKALMPCETMYVCCSWQYSHLFRQSLENIGQKIKAMIVWDKINPAQHLDKYFKQHEIIWYCGPFGGEKTLRGDVWQCKRQKNTVHPTMKPIELISMALQDQPKKKTVYDGFGGSGSTLIACEQLDRTCYMMELDPKYCDVIVKRYASVTGKNDITLVRNGKEIPVEETEILN